MIQYILEIYQQDDGSTPFLEWLDTLKDNQARYIVKARLERIRNGDFGDCEPVGAGVFELRIHFGPGYRLYFAQRGKTIVLLLCGRTKKTQKRDIQKAKAYWERYQNAQIH